MPAKNFTEHIGHITRDPELRRTAKGTAVMDLGIAVNEWRKGTDGNYGEQTTFLDYTLWGKLAERIEAQAAKGRLVRIEGRAEVDTWDDKTTGQKRSKLKLIATYAEFLDRPVKSARQETQTQPEREPDMADEEIPF